LLFVGGPENHQDTRERLRVVRQTIEELDSWRPGLTLEVAFGAFTEYSVPQILRPLLDGDPFDVIIAANDTMAIGVLKVLKLEASEAWSKCTVTGFDDIPQAVLFDPALTSVHQPLDRLGARSLDALIDLLAGRKVPQVRRIDCWPVLRESCGCPPSLVPPAPSRPTMAWGPSQKLAAEAERWLRDANYLAGDLGMVENRSEIWMRLDVYFATLGLSDLAILEAGPSLGDPRTGLRIVFQRRQGKLRPFGPSGQPCGLDELLDSLDHPGGGSWDSTVTPLRSGPWTSGLAVYSAPLHVHPYVGVVLPHVAHCLKRLRDLEEHKHRNLVLEDMVQKRTRELVLANNQLLAQRRGLETILRTLPMPLVLYRNRDRQVLYANPAFEGAVGTDPVFRLVDEFLRIPDQCDGLELGLSTQSGEPVPVLTYSLPIEFEEQAAILVAMVDLTRQRALESEVLQASEWERRRFGIELHDDICQRLAGIVMYLTGLQNRKGDLLAATFEVTAMVDEALHLTRQYSHASFPIELERRGLVPALETLCESVESRTGRTVVLSVLGGEDGLPLDPQRNLNVYRIVQEALHNAVKHGRAQKLGVEVISGPSGLTVKVVDDGRGMVDQPEGTDGLGLRSMAYRAAQMGARLEWTNHPGKGVVVTLELR
jgi:signal transduction histidine kinase